MTRRPWLALTLAISFACLLTVMHHPPALAQDDASASADAGPFAPAPDTPASDTGSGDGSGLQDGGSVDASSSDTSVDGSVGSSGSDGSDSSGGVSADGGGSAGGGSFSADSARSDAGAGDSGQSASSSGGSSFVDPGSLGVGSSSTLGPSVILPAGPFGGAGATVFPQPGSPSAGANGGTRSASGNNQTGTAQAATAQSDRPERVTAQAQPRTSAGPRLLGIWSVADILKFLVALATAIVLAIAAFLQGLLEAILGGPQGVIFQTPPEYTYQLGPVVGAWNAMRVIAEAGLALMVLLAGYGLLVGHHLGLPSMEPVQVVPRVVLGFILIHFSLDWTTGLLQLNDALSHTLLGSVPTDWGLRPNASDLGGAVAWLIEVVMMLLLALGMWLRIALLDVLLPIAPLMLLLWSSPLTRSWGDWWVGLFASTALVQFFQDVALWLGSQMLKAGGGQGDQGVTSRVLAFALLLLVFRIPQLMPAFSLTPSGGTASFLGLSRGGDAIASLPVVGGVLGLPGRLLPLPAGGSHGRSGGGSAGRGSLSRTGGTDDRSRGGGGARR
jgi:hypothetical protein